ncbi:vacuolar protein sorting/targeting protein 10 [Chaetomium tenue]|uniref:Vacuolar protein sorting/targeting protein 10 n=1 Tax=Chaetomium tenue TaxID=1854479 RepID=A0ACB7PEB3_9PEZI|nr:vacuolar protein sorting/targeting protein 10 [Chaetomium globosum]
MRVRGALQAAAVLAAALWATPLAAKKNDRPTFHSKEFENIPKNLHYFSDSDTVLFQDQSANNVYLSSDHGVKWERVDAVPEGKAWMLSMHGFDSNRAYILTEGTTHFRTSDRGKTWEKFKSGVQMSLFRLDILRFHATDPDRILFNGMICEGLLCQEVTQYTTDGFKTPAKELRRNTDGCWWAKSSDLFTTGAEDLDNNRVLCVVRDSFSPYKQDQRLLISDNFFRSSDDSSDIQEFEPDLDMNKPVQGVVSIAVVKKYLLVATTSMNTDEMALFITGDTKKWHRAVFPANHEGHDHRVLQEAYTALESTNYSIQIDVMTTRPSNPMGVMFTSNSNGTYFTENVPHTNRNQRGHVDFEKVTGIQGVFLVNKVDNWEDVAKKANTKKKVVSEITFDDGRTFEPVTAGDKRIHLHSITELSNVGPVFSSPAPGLLMAIGNRGDYLKNYWDDGNLYVSDDAGKTWNKALEGPHKYEFGDQGSILVAVRDSKEVEISEINYSLDHGLTWTKQALPDGLKIRPYILTTTQESASLKFLLIGMVEESPGWRVISIDFDGLHEATCKEDDMEEWFARVDKDGKPTCLMGHTQSFPRRKKKAECFLKQEFKHPVSKTENCECTDADYECDFNFAREDGKCVAKGPIIPPEGVCRDAKPDDIFKGTSGYRKILGNTCKDTKEMDDKYKDVERKCSEIGGGGGGKPSTPATDKIEQTEKVFDEDWDRWEKHYLERGESSSSEGETIIMRGRTKSKLGPIYVTENHGKEWHVPKYLKDEGIVHIIPHQYFKDMVFFLTTGKKIIYTTDRGRTYRSFKAPNEPSDDVMPLSFHPDKKNWLIWNGKKCESSDGCYGVASYSKDGGDHWQTAGSSYTRRCEFTGSRAYKYPGRKEEQILCLKHEKESKAKDNPMVLISTNDWFDNEEIRERNVREFATMAEFVVVATENSANKTLQASASLDGTTFADALFPHGFVVPHQHIYTVLDSSTHAVNLFVATSMDGNLCNYGSILKSNSNGTSYVVSVGNVNCDEDSYVDFDKIAGLEGVAMVNVVANPDAESSAPKKLQTKITHNDGAQWAYLSTPPNDDIGKFSCQSSGDEKCALHLHGYTERRLRGNTWYSSESAVGVMVAWGNVGDSLGPRKDSDTFMTTDAGLTWKRVKEGQWTWAIGDQGGVIVLVQTTSVSRKKTKSLVYSLDQGKTWKEHEFSSDEVEVWDVTTLRSGSSRNFLLWGKGSKGPFTLKLDFSGFSEDVCKVDDDPDKSDYYLWSPKHPMQPDGCLFGHVSQYLRKKSDRKCYNDFKLQPLYGKEDCKCTREDFECDYNYQLDPFNQCSLVPGLSPADPSAWCKQHPDEIEYHEPTGYRRIPLTTCVGGRQPDKESPVHACAGHEEDFERKHAVSGIALFFAVTVPFVLAGVAGWYVWRNWNGKFGQIRLGDQGAAVFEADRPWVKYPVIVLSAVAAVVVALPVVVGAVWRSVSGLVGGRGGAGGGDGRGRWSRLGGGGRRFTTRDSFARGGDYAVVDDDEGELLGEDSDEEV